MNWIDLLPLAFVLAVAFAVDRIARLFVRVRQPTMEELRARHRAVLVQLVTLGLHPDVRRNPAAMEYALTLGEEMQALRMQMLAREGQS